MKKIITMIPTGEKAQSALTNEEINRKWEAEGTLLPKPKEGDVQVIMFRKRPKYPKKK